MGSAADLPVIVAAGRAMPRRTRRAHLAGMALLAIACSPPGPSTGEPTLPVRFRAVSHVAVEIKEPSDVTALPGGGFLVVGDQSDNLLVVWRDGSSAKFDLKGVNGGDSGLEAIAFDASAKRLFVSEEEKRTIRRYRFDPANPAAPELEEKIVVDLGGDANKGIEGMCHLPASHSPTGQPQLVIAKERGPRLLALLPATGIGPLRPIPLPKGLKGGCPDFAALAVDPLTGHLFVASEESSSLAEIEVGSESGAIVTALVGVTPLLDAGRHPFPRVEGITFNEAGDLFVLLEDRRELHRLERVR